MKRILVVLAFAVLACARETVDFTGPEQGNLRIYIAITGDVLEPTSPVSISIDDLFHYSLPAYNEYVLPVAVGTHAIRVYSYWTGWFPSPHEDCRAVADSIVVKVSRGETTRVDFVIDCAWIE